MHDQSAPDDTMLGTSQIEAKESEVVFSQKAELVFASIRGVECRVFNAQPDRRHRREGVGEIFGGFPYLPTILLTLATAEYYLRYVLHVPDEIVTR